jgi:hypothetical protein
LSEGRTSKESSYASEGTKAHDVAEQALLSGEDASCDDPDMQAAVQKYVDEVRNARKGVDIICEHTERTLKSTKMETLGGTSDHYMVYLDEGKTVLHVFDYKHGVGVPVSVENNLQVLSYLHTISSNYPEQFDEFRATIVQPRCFDGTPIQHWSCDAKRVDEHFEAIVEADGKTDLKVGDWCRWCPAIIVCPKLEEHTLELAQAEFSEYRDDTEKLLELQRITPAVKAFLEKVPLAIIEKFQDGSGGIEGFKCIERLSNRQWKSNEASMVAALQEAGIDEEMLFNQKLKTPPQLEKDLTDKKVIEPFITRRVVGYKVVPVSNKNEAVDFRANEFTEISNDEN